MNFLIFRDFKEFFDFYEFNSIYFKLKKYNFIVCWCGNQRGRGEKVSPHGNICTRHVAHMYACAQARVHVCMHVCIRVRVGD